jgi:exopolysaccharide biosynthesis polyprenyl glycosylphosphotransferase
MSTNIQSDLLVSVEEDLATPAAPSEPTERLGSASVATPPSHHLDTVVAFGRFACVMTPFLAAALVISPSPMLGRIVPLGIGWSLAIHAGQSLLPSAARFGRVTWIVIGVSIALTITLALTRLLGTMRVSTSELVAIAVAVAVLSIAFEMWVSRWKRPLGVLVVGKTTGGEALADALADGHGSPWFLAGFVNLRTGAPDERAGQSRFTRDVLELRPDIVVLSDSASRDDALDELLSIPSPSFRVVSLDHFSEHAFGRVSVSSVSPLWFMSLLHIYRRPYSRMTQRALDLLLVTLGFALAWPLMAVSALLVWRSGPGSILYRQRRVGEGGVPFHMLKFRTMAVDAERDGKPAWASADDPRITRVGRWLRRYRLDELPQMWNVVRGEMRVVGPRPERPEFVEALEQRVPHWSRRNLVKPGITGWAQINNGYTDDEETAADKLSYDLFYIKHRSLAFDLVIILKTVGVVVGTNGAR